MATFAPEFSQYWLHGRDVHTDVLADATALAAARADEERALEELADRVSAARSVV